MADTEFFRGFPEIYMRVNGPLPEQAEQFKQMQVAAGVYGLSKQPSGMVLHGTAGAGKSALASMLARFFVEDRHGCASFLSCSAMGLYLRGLPSERPEGKRLYDYAELIDPREFALLVIDDVGAEAASPDARDLVRLALHERESHPCITIMTTNLTPAELLAHLGGERERSRMAAYRWIKFARQPDYRKPTRSPHVPRT